VSRSGKSGNLCGIQYAGPHRSNGTYGVLVLLTMDNRDKAVDHSRSS
jgi:hypothetical protein